MFRIIACSSIPLMTIVIVGWAQTPGQPKVAPGANEPDWVVILEDRYGLSMFGDLLNPVRTAPERVPGLFRKAGAGPVRYTPVIALGLETRNRGGWYAAQPGTGKDDVPKKRELWSYVFKNTTDDLRTGKNLPPPLAAGSTTEFDPGEGAFGFWVSNDGLDDGGVFTEPALVARINRRLAKQAYKAMIYPNRDKTSGKIIPHSYLIGWEYSTNDDFQDVVCKVDNVTLVDDLPQAKPSATR
jgi:hypothetical protein